MSYNCYKCNKSFSRHWNLERHQKQLHMSTVGKHPDNTQEKQSIRLQTNQSNYINKTQIYTNYNNNTITDHKNYPIPESRSTPLYFRPIFVNNFKNDRLSNYSFKDMVKINKLKTQIYKNIPPDTAPRFLNYALCSKFAFKNNKIIDSMLDFFDT